MFKVEYQTNVELSEEDMTSLFCSIGQGSSYWCEDVSIGRIETDSEGYYKGEYEWEGCAAWAKKFTLDDPISGMDREDEEPVNIKIKDLLEAINKISSNQTNIHWDYASQIASCFKAKKDDEEIDMGLIDAGLADLIFQVACFGDTVYG